MNFPRMVLGFHGCSKSRAEALLSGKMPISAWPVSKKRWEWLGEAIYFWEHAPDRALRWAEERVKGTREKPAVVGAIIMLSGDDVLDLTDVRFGRALRNTHRELEQLFAHAGKTLPENKDKFRDLDCLVINALCEANPGLYSIVRAAFEEGAPIFPGSRLHEQTHIQLAVRDAKAIMGIFRPV
jgi:hypothetical protein